MTTSPIIKDNRTDAQRETMTWAVIGSDRFMYGWGEAKGRPSSCAWACTMDQIDTVEKWVLNRKDMKRVRVVNLKTYRPKGAVHISIHPCHENHPALNP